MLANMLRNLEYGDHTSISCLSFCSEGGGLLGHGDCDSLCTVFFPPIVPSLSPITPIFAPWRFRVGGGDEGGIQGELSLGLEELSKGLLRLQEAGLDLVEKSKSLEVGRDKGGIGDLGCL